MAEDLMRGAAGAVATVFLLLAQPAAAAFRAPFATPAPATAARPITCGAIPASVTALDTAQPYRAGDASFSRYDPVRQATRQSATAPIRQMTAALARFANGYVASRGRDTRSGACALILLQTWANADALARMRGHDAQFLRSVALSGWALDYAQVRGLRIAGADPRPVILAWFGRMAGDLRHHYDGLANATARNNHRAWAGLAAAAVALDTGDASLANWGLRSARIALDQVTPAGALPLELARGTRARHYHLYAAAPLVMTAEIAAANGVDLYGYRSRALLRLAAFAAASISSPVAMLRLAGAVQEPFADGRGRFDTQNVAWAEFYDRRFPGRLPGIAAILANRPLINTELGGNLTLLAARR